jgi:adenylate cyclase
MEIERKFLVPALPPDYERYPHAGIVQGYLVLAENGAEVRLRRHGDRYVQTVKSGEGRVRNEVEVDLTRDQFEALWQAVSYTAIEKTRYEIPFEGHTIELDVYHGALGGLVTAEVEFDSVAASDVFTPPAWFGTEVTEDRRYRNRELARSGWTRG